MPVPSKLYFSAVGTGNSGPDLYVLDANGTLTPDPLRSDPSASYGSFAGDTGGFAPYNGNLYFFAFTTTTDEALFQLDPTGTLTPVSDGSGGYILTPQEDAHFTQFAGSLYFEGITANGGDQLIRLDSSGTEHVIVLNPSGQESFAGQNGGFTEFDGSLYFSSQTLQTNHYNPDLIKLAPNGTWSEISTRTPANAQFGSAAGEDGGFVVFNKALYFNAISDTVGDTLFKLDAGSTTPVAIDPAGATFFHEYQVDSVFHQFNGSLYFNEFSFTVGNDTLFRLDANNNLTALTFNGDALQNAGELGGYADFAGSTYFIATTATDGTQIYKLDTNGNISEIRPNTSGDSYCGCFPASFTQFNGSLYFAADDSTGGDGVFKLDANGTLTEVYTGPGGITSAANLTVFSNSLYFSAYTANGDELVKLNADGSSQAFDINTTAGQSSFPGALGGFATFPNPGPPTLGGIPADASYVPGQSSALLLAPHLTISDPTTTELQGATVKLTGGFTGDGDLLAADTSGTTIVAAWDAPSETLTLSGAASVTEYQAVLDSVAYSSSNADPQNTHANLTRTITWQVTDANVTPATSAPYGEVLDFQKPTSTYGLTKTQLDSLLSSAGFVAATRTQVESFLTNEGFFSNPATILVSDSAYPPLDPTTQFAIVTAPSVTATTDAAMKFLVDSTAGSALTVTGSTDIGIATGAGDNKVILQDSGNDTVYLGPGANSVYGGAGNDTLIGSTGVDLLVAGRGGGILRSGTTASGQINSLNDATSTAHTMYGGAGNDSLYSVGSASDSLVAGSGNNALYGFGTGANTLDASGTSGNDSLYGGDGHDSLQGGLGLDLLVAGAGTGVLRSGSGVGGANSLNDNTTSAHTLYGALGNDSLYAVGSGNDQLIGGSGNQVLSAMGSTGSNSLQATGGNDTLYAGSGNDTLDASGSTANVLFWSGAAGNDTMKGSDAADFFDIVHDVAGQKIDITGSALASFQAVGFVDSGRAQASASYDIVSNPGHTIISFADSQQVTVDSNIHTLYFTDGTKTI